VKGKMGHNLKGGDSEKKTERHLNGHTDFVGRQGRGNGKKKRTRIFGWERHFTPGNARNPPKS